MAVMLSQPLAKCVSGGRSGSARANCMMWAVNSKSLMVKAPWGLAEEMRCAANAGDNTSCHTCAELEASDARRKCQLLSSACAAGKSLILLVVEARRNCKREKSPMPPGITGTMLRSVPTSLCHLCCEVRLRERGIVSSRSSILWKQDWVGFLPEGIEVIIQAYQRFNLVAAKPDEQFYGTRKGCQDPDCVVDTSRLIFT
eukprot:15347487-Ditylum_brightwellii.AAC.1